MRQSEEYSGTGNTLRPVAFNILYHLFLQRFNIRLAGPEEYPSPGNTLGHRQTNAFPTFIYTYTDTLTDVVRLTCRAIRPKKDIMTFYLTKFDFASSVFQAIASEAEHSPPSSPPSQEAHTLTDLSDLSPLTTPPSSPSSSTLSLLDSVTKTAAPQPLIPAPEWASAYQVPSYQNAVNLDKGEGGSQLDTPARLDTPAKSRQEKHKTRQRLRNRQWRKKQRAEQKETTDSFHTPRDGPRIKYVDTAIPINCEQEAAQCKATVGGYTGLKGGGSKRVWRLSEMVGDGSKWKFRLIKWDGSSTKSILDKSRRLIGILAGHPQTQDWPSVHSQAADAMEAQRSRLYVPKKMRRHRRGAFPALATGISFGGGQRYPSNLSNDPPNAIVLEWLRGLQPFKRIAGFASAVMATWAPKLHEYYAQTLTSLLDNNPTLQRLFPSSIFCAASYNFGPQTICFKHKDFANLPFGFCAITALGNFDPTKGGHLILWDLKLVIEFPPGSTILIPSAIVAHSNIPIGKDERRYSFTQYTAGAIFRWVENEFMDQETYLSLRTPEELASVQEKNNARWTHGLSLLPTFSSCLSVVDP